MSDIPSGALDSTESRAVSLLDSVEPLLASAAAGRIRSYRDVLMHSRQGE